MSAPPQARPTAVEWAKRNGDPFTWSALFDNRDSPPQAGIGWDYWGWPEGMHSVGKIPAGGIVIENANRFMNAKESLYLVQQGGSGSMKAYYVAGWISSENTMILHLMRPSVPHGPKRAYHLVTQHRRIQGAV